MKSKCCNSTMHPALVMGGNSYYICDSCLKPCDFHFTTEELGITPEQIKNAQEAIAEGKRIRDEYDAKHLEKELLTFVEDLIFDINQGFDHNSIYKDIKSLLQSQRTQLIDEIVGLECMKKEKHKWGEKQWNNTIDDRNQLRQELKNQIINLKEK